MNDTDEQHEAVEESTSSIPHSKRTRIFMGALLTISVALNITLLALIKLDAVEPVNEQEASDVIEEDGTARGDGDNRAVKDFSTLGAFTWVGRVVDEAYELVRINNEGQELIVETFPHGPCDEVQWNHKSDGRFTFKYSTSPCEAYVESTEIVFNQEGRRTLQSHYQSDSDTVTFQTPSSPIYTAKLRTSGGCTNEVGGYQDDGTFVLPKTELFGIVVESDGGSKQYDLPHSETIDCGTGYGDAIIPPYVSNVESYESAIGFTLPNGKRAGITIEGRSKLYVDFY